MCSLWLLSLSQVAARSSPGGPGSFKSQARSLAGVDSGGGTLADTRGGLARRQVWREGGVQKACDGKAVAHKDAYSMSQCQACGFVMQCRLHSRVGCILHPPMPRSYSAPAGHTKHMLAICRYLAQCSNIAKPTSCPASQHHSTVPGHM